MRDRWFCRAFSFCRQEEDKQIWRCECSALAGRDPDRWSLILSASLGCTCILVKLESDKKLLLPSRSTSKTQTEFKNNFDGWMLLWKLRHL